MNKNMPEESGGDTVEVLTDFVTIITQEGARVYTSSSYKSFFGHHYDSGDFWSEIHPDDRDEIRLHFKKILKTGQPRRLHYRLNVSDRKPRWVESRWHLITGVDGNSRLIVVVSHLITKSKLPHQQVSENVKYFKSLVENISDALLLVNRLGTILYASSTNQKVTGRGFKELAGHDFTEWIHPEDADRVREQFNRLRENPGPTVSMEFRLRHTDDTWRWMEGVANNLMQEPSVQGIVINYRDVTERKKSEEELLKAKKIESIGVLAGGIAHDFNNILAVIMGNLSLAKSKLTGKDQKLILDLLNEAQKASRRAKELTQQLVTFSKGGAPIKKALAISEMIRTSISLFHDSTLSVKLDLDENLGESDLDMDQMNHVIHQILLNAHEAMPNGGRVFVRAHRIELAAGSELHLPCGTYIKISIQDEGVGIASENLSKIFDPYFTTKKAGGGLGLATSYSIVKNHGGLITVDSTPAHGATFQIYIPVTTTRPNTISARSPGAISGKILVMDDEESIRSMAVEMLQHFGFEAITAPDGHSTLNLYKAAYEERRPFDLVILDLNIVNGMGGRETIKKLVAFDPFVRAVASSGYSHDPVMSRYSEYGFYETLPKPYSLEDLERVLKTLNMKSI